MLSELDRAPALRFVQLGGGRSLHLREWSGSGDPLVLLHGLMSCSASWSHIAGPTGRPCYAVDLPGFGDSSLPSPPRLAAYAMDIVSGLRALGVGSFTLVGHSFGGGVAIAVAELVPDAVERLVLCAPAGFGRLPLAEVAALPLVKGLASGVAPCVRRRPLPRRHVDVDPPRTRRGRDTRLRGPAEWSRLRPGMRSALEALAAAGRSPGAFYRRRVTYAGPVAAIWGDRDGVIPPSHIAGLTVSLPQSEVHVWSGMGHHPHRERIDQLTEFISGRSTPLASHALENAGERAAA